jgi:hypothetical protein
VRCVLLCGLMQSHPSTPQCAFFFLGAPLVARRFPKWGPDNARSILIVTIPTPQPHTGDPSGIAVNR